MTKPLNVLRIDSSIFGKGGVSAQLTDNIIEQVTAAHELVAVRSRELSGDSIPHLTLGTINDIGEGKADLADELIAELQSADVVVLGIPMYNFGVPSEFKAWFDHVARAKVTFEYTSNGPVGLLKNKKVYVVTTRGGIYKDQAKDLEVPFLKTILSFVGLDDVEFIYAEGLSLGDDKKEKAISDAKTQIAHLIQSNAA